jgi:hypothetical protein
MSTYQTPQAQKHGIKFLSCLKNQAYLIADWNERAPAAGTNSFQNCLPKFASVCNAKNKNRPIVNNLYLFMPMLNCFSHHLKVLRKQQYPIYYSKFGQCIQNNCFFTIHPVVPKKY